MSMADSPHAIKGNSLMVLAEQLESSIREAARKGTPLHEVEKDTFQWVLEIGHRAIEQLLILQGDGNLGESVVTAEGRRLDRSEEPVERPLRTVFGEHTIRAYVYAEGPKKAVQLRPVERTAELAARTLLVFLRGILAILLRGPGFRASVAGAGNRAATRGFGEYARTHQSANGRAG